MRSHTLLRLFLFCGLIALTLYQLRIALIAQTAYSNIGADNSIAQYQSEPRLLALYAEQDILQGDYKNARKRLQKALQVNPAYIPAWLTLAELENNIGNSARSLEILEYLDHLMQGVLRWRWKKTMLAYLLGREDILKADLSWLLQQKNLSWKSRQRVLNFAFSLWPDPENLLREMGHTNSEQLFLHAVQVQKIALADFFWPVLDQSQLDVKKVVQYINLLITNQKIDDAALVWHKYYPYDNLLYNGHFSLPLVKGGFGWRIWPTEGIETSVQTSRSGRKFLHVDFIQEKNINFYHVNQLIPLQPNQSYTLTGELSSKGLTSNQLPFIEIAGRDCSFSSATEMVKPNQDWTPFSLSFTIPDACRQGVVVRLRRHRSKRINSLITGEVGISNLSLQNTPSSSIR